MSASKPQAISAEDIADVLDNPEWTTEDFAAARPFAEAFPALMESIRQNGLQRPVQRARAAVLLDEEVVAAYRATGDGWQERTSQVLRDAMDKG